MKMQKKFGTVLIVLCIISGFFVKLTVKADNLSEDIMAETIEETEITTEAETEIATEPEEETEIATEPEAETEITTEPEVKTEITAEQDNSEELQIEKAEGSSEQESFDEIPMFEACLEHSPQGWIVKGVLKDIAADTILVQPMCSTDGKTYRECGQEWNLQWLGSEDEGELAKLQNQRCLFESEEPFKSYLTKDLDRFYIKLRVVREGGVAYETQAAIIDRGELQSVPADFNISVIFAPGVLVREGRPPNIQYYGRCQMTISEDASKEEVSALLPDTLPVEIQLQKGSDYIGNDIIDCPVKWKALNLPQLTAGGSVSVLDAAEEIVIPSGIVLNTQAGIYRLNGPISMEQYGITDEVRIVLNVVAKDAQPAGVLAEDRDGLKMAFQLKPTGAASIRAYTITKGESEWTELLGLSLIDAINAQPSTANSDYTVVLGKEQEPYRSYLKAQQAGEEPIPFFVGLKIEGGIYDGRQLVLAWPDTYELPLDLPKISGSGGNQGNAGSNGKNNSTEGGKRLGLQQDTEDESMPETTKEPENRIVENEMLEINMAFSEQQQETTPPVQHKPAARTAIEADIEMEEEMPDGASDTIAVMDTVPSGYVEGSAQPDIQENPDGRISSVDNGVLFAAAACIFVLICTGISVLHILQRKADVRIMNALHRFYTKKNI